MTNLERLKTFNAKEMADFLRDHAMYRCQHCAYHYDKNCPEKLHICSYGFKEWFESDTTRFTQF